MCAVQLLRGEIATSAHLLERLLYRMVCAPCHAHTPTVFGWRGSYLSCHPEGRVAQVLKVAQGYGTPAQGAEDVWRADGSGRKNQPSHVWRLPCARSWRSQRAHQRVLSTSRSRTSAWLDMEPRRSFRRHPTAENSLPGDFLTSRSMRDR